MENYDLFVKEVSIKNYKSLKDVEVKLNVPNGNLGSGLTLLIGENGAGKTSLLESINLTFSGRFAENTLDFSHLNDMELPIQIECKYKDRIKVKSGIDFYKDWYFVALGVIFKAEPRDSKKPGSYFSPSISGASKFSLDEEIYLKGDDEPHLDRDKQTKQVDGRDQVYEISRVKRENKEEAGFNVFFFSPAVTRHLKSGTYRTSFDKFLEDLSWKFNKKLKTLKSDDLDGFEALFNNDFSQTVNDITQKGLGKNLANEFANFFDDKNFSNLSLEIIDYRNPYTSAFLALRGDKLSDQIRVSELGSGVEFILAVLFQKILAEQSKGKNLYLIDEPESHLHPRAQRKFCEMLLEESKKHQIVVSSHSPYIVQSLLQSAGAVEMRRDETGNVEARVINGKNGLFLWSPSVGEVNYRAFGLCTVEFHNELYGFGQSKANTFVIEKFDDFLENTHGILRNKTWHNDKSGKDENVTICSYIRNSIHHPENISNNRYTDNEMKKSTESLVRVVETMNGIANP